MKRVILFSFLSFICGSLFSGTDLSYKWKVYPYEVNVSDLKRESFIPASKFLGRDYRIKHPRIPGKVYWFLFEVEKPQDVSVPYLIYFKEGPVVKNVYFNGEKINRYSGEGITRGGGGKWNIFGKWYILPSSLWKEGKNEILVEGYDIRFLNDNIFGKVYFDKADLYRLLQVNGSFKINSYENWYGYIDIKNISPFNLKFKVKWIPFDYFGKILGEKKEKEISLSFLEKTRVVLPCEDEKTYKFKVEFESNLGKFKYMVYVFPPYKKTSTRKIWCLDVPERNGTYRKHFWEVMKWEKDSPLEYPPPESGWQRFPVPFPYRERLERLHRMWYRTYFDIEKIEKRKKYYLYFESVYEDCQIWVNGKKVGEHKQGEIPFYIDITEAIKEGKNELLVGVVGWIANLKPEIPKPILGVTKSVSPGSLIRPGWPRGVYWIGITKSVYLMEMPEIWIKNALVRTWIDKGKLDVIVKIENSNRKKEKVKALPTLLFEGEKIKEFEPFEIELKEGETIKKLIYNYKFKHLWTPETPNLYQLNLKILKEGKIEDESNFRFGARQWAIKGNKILLNGKEIKIYEEYAPGLSVGYHTKYSINTAYRFFTTKKYLGQFSNRYFYYSAKETIDVADEIGFIVGQEGGLDANAGTHFAYQDERLKKSLLKVFESKIWERGNHPSIILWDTGNECYAPWLAKAEWLDEIEEKIFKMDPTRFVTNDRQYDLEGKGMLPNPHYPWYGVLPNDAYWYGSVSEIPEEERERRKRQFETNPNPWEKLEIERKITTLFQWYKRKPLWIGEFSWINEREIPGFLAANWGEDAMTYWPPAARHNWSFGSLSGLSKNRELLYIGYRQCGVNSFHAHCWPYVQLEALSPMAVFPREFSKQFYSGDKVIRNLSIHNDTFKTGKFTVEYSLIERWKNKKILNRKFDIYLGQFDLKWKRVEIKLPEVKKRKEFIFRISLYYKNKVVYTKDYVWEIVGRKEIEDLKEGIGGVFLYDTTGKTRKALEKIGVKCKEVNDFGNLPFDGILIIGQNSLDENVKKYAPLLINDVKKGLTIIFLGQNYLGKTAPITFGPFNFKYPARPVYTAVAYPVNYSHPVLKNFDYYDFCWWGNDHIVAFELFNLPEKGNYKPLILTNTQGRGRGLKLPALLEIPLEKGNIYFCQMDVVRKAGKVPAADQLLLQLIKYGKPERKFGRKFTILEIKDGVLSNVFRYNLGIDNLNISQNLKNISWPLMFFGERGSKIREIIEKNVEKIRKYIEEGNTLYICDLDEKDKEWFEELIDGKVDFKIMPSTQATKINYSFLLDGITNEQLIWAMFSHTPLDKRKPNPADIVRKTLKIKTEYSAKPLIYPEGLWEIKIGKGKVVIDNLRWRKCNFSSANKLALILLTNVGVEIPIKEEKIVKKDYSYLVKSKKVFFVNIKKFCNWSYIDKVNKPGWIGYGPFRDLRNIPKGKVKFLGIPFYIVSPEENNGKTIISLYGPDNKVETGPIPVNKKAEVLVFLHSAAWVNAKEGDALASYIIRYDKEFMPPEPPPEEVIPLKRRYNIEDWWYIGMRDFKLMDGEVAWTDNFEGHKAGIFLYIWKNPKPELPIKWIKIKAAGKGQVFVFSITGIAP